MVADIIPTKMGYAVDPTGEKDSTSGIQKALNDCFMAGGGTVFLPTGNYVISDTLYIPSYVTLRGDYQDPDEGVWKLNDGIGEKVTDVTIIPDIENGPGADATYYKVGANETVDTTHNIKMNINAASYGMDNLALSFWYYNGDADVTTLATGAEQLRISSNIDNLSNNALYKPMIDIPVQYGWNHIELRLSDWPQEIIGNFSVSDIQTFGVDCETYTNNCNADCYFTEFELVALTTEDNELEYGTIISVKTDAIDSTSSGIFSLSGSSGVVGLTVYYPNQTLSGVLPYPYTFYVPHVTNMNMLMTIKDITVINGYRGIGTEYDLYHECLIIDNFKGTFLNTALALHNQSDVGRVDNVTISSKYWAEACVDGMESQNKSDIETYMKANTVGMVTSCLEWTTFSRIQIEDCSVGIRFTEGAREDLNAISMLDVDVEDCNRAMVIDTNAHDARWGSLIANSNINGEIDNNTTAIVKMTNVDVENKEPYSGTLFSHKNFSKTSILGDDTVTGTATATSNGQEETFDYITISRGVLDDDIGIENKVTTTLDLSDYEWDELAIEFWMKCSTASVTSFEDTSYLRMGTGTAKEAPYLEFKAEDFTLKAGEWTKFTLNLCDATKVGTMITSDKLTWAYLKADGVGSLGSSISISDIEIVELNVVENASDDLSCYAIDYDATYTKPKKQLFVAKLQKGTTKDVSEELQQLLTQAGNAGGGIVYVPGGTYRFDNPLQVPTGVELRGTSAVASREQWSNNAGTVFLCYYGDEASYDAETDEAFITLSGENSGVNGLRIIYPENGPRDDNLNTTYTVRGKAAGVYVVNCYIMASANGVDFKACDNHYIKGVYSCCWENTFRLGGTNGVIRDCHHNGNMVIRTNAKGLPEDWPKTEEELLTVITDPIIRKTAQYIIVDGAENELVQNVFAYAVHEFLINKDSLATLAVNVGTDNIGDDGVQFTQKGGSMTVINAMRWNGQSYNYVGGKLNLFNRICINDTTEQNMTIGEEE